jgi:hypothetical protein
MTPYWMAMPGTADTLVRQSEFLSHRHRKQRQGLVRGLG